MQCDECGYHWHGDCLDPPVARGPRLLSKTRTAFICPLHTDTHAILGASAVPESGLGDREMRTYKLREPKDMESIAPHFARGTWNNGMIDVDVEEDMSKETYDKKFIMPDWDVYQDFIVKAKM
jgi:hypothetical protein